LSLPASFCLALLSRVILRLAIVSRLQSALRYLRIRNCVIVVGEGCRGWWRYSDMGCTKFGLKRAGFGALPSGNSLIAFVMSRLTLRLIFESLLLRAIVAVKIF
jgi:hypothetical protein